MPEPNLTPRQQRYFEAMQASLERDTGRPLAEWVAIARTCPETAHRARLKWLKDNFGLLQNHGTHVLNEAFADKRPWEDPDALIAALWVDQASRAIFEAVDAVAQGLNPVIRTARKGYTAWSREFQFAAVRPVRGGTAMLGLALAPEADPRLEPPRNEPWSERLKSRTALATPLDVDADIAALLRQAWERSG